MRRAATGLLAVLLAAPEAGAAPVLDQEAWGSPSAAVATSSGVFRRAMSFTVGLAGELVRIDIATTPDVDPASRLDLLATLAGVPQDSVLASGSFAGTADGVASYVFAGLAVAPGEVLAIEPVGAGASWLVEGSTSYAGGEDFTLFPPAGQTSFTANGLDLFFRSFVEPAAVPAPGGAFALGLLALGLLRRRR